MTIEGPANDLTPLIVEYDPKDLWDHGEGFAISFCDWLVREKGWMKKDDYSNVLMSEEKWRQEHPGVPAERIVFYRG